MYEIHSYCVGVGNTDYLIGVNHANANRGLAPYPGYFWYVEGDGRNIVVDSGRPKIEDLRERFGGEEHVPSQPHITGGQEEIQRILRENHDIQPEDIDIVICTHLHADHNWNIDMFSNATAFVQEDEIAHAVNPSPHQRFAYSRECMLNVIKRKQPENLVVVDGDYEVCDGVEVLKSPVILRAFKRPSFKRRKER
jgi:glyoxylase-like metal-dependent hydrolase (beta-lactamase superfamily II)